VLSERLLDASRTIGKPDKTSMTFSCRFTKRFGETCA
jgi:hypothetical protein